MGVNPFYDGDGRGRSKSRPMPQYAAGTPEADLIRDVLAANKHRKEAGLEALSTDFNDHSADADSDGKGTTGTKTKPAGRGRGARAQRRPKPNERGSALRRLSHVASERVRWALRSDAANSHGPGGSMLKNHSLDNVQRWRQAAIFGAYFLLGWGFFALQEPEGIGATFLDSMYWTIVSVTTVGYGDHYPTTKWGMGFSIVYLAAGLVLVGGAISQFGQAMLEKAEEMMLRKLDDDPDDDEPPDDRWQLAIAGLSIVGVAIAGTIFFALAEEDHWDKPVQTSFYFAIATMSTVGYGDVTVSQGHSKAFAIFFILLSTCVFATSVDKVHMVYAARAAEKKKQAFLALELDIAQILAMDESGDGQVDKGEFLYFGLQMTGVLEANDPDVDRIMAAFDEYDKDGSGSLDHADLELLLQEEEKKRLLRVEEAEAAAAAKAEARASKRGFSGRLRTLSAIASGRMREREPLV